MEKNSSSLYSVGMLYFWPNPSSDVKAAIFTSCQKAKHLLWNHILECGQNCNMLLNVTKHLWKTVTLHHFTSFCLSFYFIAVSLSTRVFSSLGFVCLPSVTWYPQERNLPEKNPLKTYCSYGHIHDVLSRVYLSVLTIHFKLGVHFKIIIDTVSPETLQIVINYVHFHLKEGFQEILQAFAREPLTCHYFRKICQKTNSSFPQSGNTGLCQLVPVIIVSVGACSSARFVSREGTETYR